MPYAVENITIASASREELPIVARLAERIWPEAYRTILDEGQIRYMLMEIRFWFSAAPMLMFPCHLIRTSTG